MQQEADGKRNRQLPISIWLMKIRFLRLAEIRRRGMVPGIWFEFEQCSRTGSRLGREHPEYAEPKRIKGGYKWIPKQRPEQWNVGVRLGAAIRNYQASEAHDRNVEPTGRTVRPHIRRAHWHGYWTGPRKEPAQQRFIHRWIPPIPVNVAQTDEGELPAVIRDVK